MRKNDETPDADFEYYDSIRIRSDMLRLDGDGRIVECLPLLTLFQNFVDQFRSMVAPDIRIGQVCVEEGAYVAAIYARRGLPGIGSKLKGMLERLNRCVDALEVNAKRPDPQSASACGVTREDLDVLQAARKLNCLGPSIVLTTDNGDELGLSAPTEPAVLALRPSTQSGRKVDGQVTGIGKGNERGARIEVHGSGPCIAEGYSLEDAWPLLRDGLTVTGSGNWCAESGAYVLVIIEKQPELGF